MTAETKLCGGCGRPVRLTAKACAFCKTSTDEPGREAPAQCDTMDVSGGRCTLLAGHSGNHIMGSAGGKPAASFARIIVTPVIVLIAGFLIFGLYGLLGGAVISIAYVLYATSRH